MNLCPFTAIKNIFGCCNKDTVILNDLWRQVRTDKLTVIKFIRTLQKKDKKLYAQMKDYFNDKGKRNATPLVQKI